jgi:hypothetical protein
MLVAWEECRNSLASTAAGIIFALSLRCEFLKWSVMIADCSLPKSVG